MQIPVIDAARELGLRTIVTDYNSEAQGMKIADIALEVSTRNIDFSVLAARKIADQVRVDGVLTVGTDASRTVSAVAAALELPGIRFDVAERATDKIKMRQAFKDHNVPSPDFRYVWTRAEAHEAAEQLGLPLVIKPSDNMGARGVRMITEKSQIEQAFVEARRASVSGMIIMEEYMEGPELSIDMLVHDGKIHVVGIADRIIEGAPYFIERGHILPSALPQEVTDQAVEVMKKGIHALGIDIGAAKGDIKITPSGPKIGELAARLSGGFMSGFTYPLATGVNLMKAALKICIGEDPGDLTPVFNKVSADRAVIPEPGVITNIRGVEEAEKIPGVDSIYTWFDLGDEMQPVRSNMGKFANILAAADTREQLNELLDRAQSTIQVTTDPGKAIRIERDEDRKPALVLQEKDSRAVVAGNG